MRSMLRLLIVMSLVPASLGQAVVRVPEISGLPGTTVNVPVMIDGAVDLSALQLTLEYDPAKLSVESDDWVLSGNVLFDHGLDVVRESGKVRVMPSLHPSTC